MKSKILFLIGFVLVIIGALTSINNYLISMVPTIIGVLLFVWYGMDLLHKLYIKRDKFSRMKAFFKSALRTTIYIIIAAYLMLFIIYVLAFSVLPFWLTIVYPIPALFMLVYIVRNDKIPSIKIGIPKRGEIKADEQELVTELYEALKEAKNAIHVFHGDPAWNLYQSSPEMKKISVALKRTEEEFMF